jgi:hypothetical protein
MKIARFALATLFLFLMTFGVSNVVVAVGTVDPPACAVNSWSPEMFSFYGDKATVLAKFQKLDRDLLKHRTWAFIVESNQGAKLTFFELQGKDEKTMDLSSATGASFNDLSNQIAATLLQNNGDKCAGRLTKELVASYTNGQMAHAAIPRVASAGEAFQYAVTAANGEYVHATFILLC